jgi:hypothetical protein
LRRGKEKKLTSGPRLPGRKGIEERTDTRLWLRNGAGWAGAAHVGREKKREARGEKGEAGPPWPMREKERKKRPEVENWAAGLCCLSFFLSFSFPHSNHSNHSI